MDAASPLLRLGGCYHAWCERCESPIQLPHHPEAMPGTPRCLHVIPHPSGTDVRCDHDPDYLRKLCRWIMAYELNVKYAPDRL